MSDEVLSGPAEPGTKLGSYDIEDIKRMIPHRYPFLMIDRVVDVVAEQSAVGIKNVSSNEPHFQGHFPAQAVMPGVLIIEAMAQTAAVLVASTVGEAAVGKLVYFMMIDQARFRKPVVPGDQVQLEVTTMQRRLGMWKLKGRATVDGQLVAEAIVGAKIVGV
ncbi:MAG: 3-hydroxyacyl-ACP dehydratase FabZ [Geminicoccaceae bacterium]